ncbi:hypothetical protein [Streptomyces sp. SID4982]|uniref:hypothetical protein n=1 Tax=Streptomyces sp. SID4982 TaxID=2690291 RepID=UPI00136C86B4|nr:hypothetical protein [Streptomyces sp. SID4982]MYS15041.1 hypothetical protein [Streptomyces sp. SID4982]
MTEKPRKPWRVILAQRGVQLAEIEHSSEKKAFEHVRTALGAGADTAKVMQWEGGRWWHFETVTADEIRAAQAATEK